MKADRALRHEKTALIDDPVIRVAHDLVTLGAQSHRADAIKLRQIAVRFLAKL